MAPISSLVLFSIVVDSTDSRHVLEPANGVLHCAGQSPDAFKAYSSFMAPHAKPGVSMTYTSLQSFKSRNSGSKWAMRVLASMANEVDTIVPQIGLKLPGGDVLSKVSKSQFEVAISEFVSGLRALNRPAYVRVGYEFNGNWNNYPRGAYKAAYRSIVTAWKADPKLAQSIAGIWDFSCDSSPDRLKADDWYPGDDIVDWWGVNIFANRSNPDASCVLDFVAKAKSKGFPVALGESTPRTRGVLNSAAYQLKHGNLCMDVGHGSVDPGAQVLMRHCGIHAPTGNWYQMSNNHFQNGVGLCLAVSGMGTAAGTHAVTWNCVGGEDKVWTRTAGNGLTNGQGVCLQPSTELLGIVTVSACTGGPEQSWEWIQDGTTGANATWNDWFKPYLALMNDQAVKMACYIDWNWRDFSKRDHHNWFAWGDCRVESDDASLIGGKWRNALSNSSVINAMSSGQICDVLGCNGVSLLV